MRRSITPLRKGGKPHAAHGVKLYPVSQFSTTDRRSRKPLKRNMLLEEEGGGARARYLCRRQQPSDPAHREAVSKAGRNVSHHAGRKRSAVATCVAYIRHRGVEAVFEIPSESGEKSGGAQTTTWTVTKGRFSLQHTPQQATAIATTAHIGRWMVVGTRTSVEEPVSSQGRPGALNQLHRTQR